MTRIEYVLSLNPSLVSVAMSVLQDILDRTLTFFMLTTYLLDNKNQDELLSMKTDSDYQES